ncbi:Demethylmenaquinone methyltransferase [Lachnellula occidentalis]|uniref:Demethylmenaquinone methyltransferase n=1 Tax=Lachnellula occidentalis TaxID=215460 RepID=A0A8H8S522_9HELO|nr:Demethylmenaquinone methyltransferase [Lachnellula occidentalis]
MADKSDVSPLCDHFNAQASTYERRLGGSPRRAISHALDLLPGLSSTRAPILLDNACGPGFATEAFLEAYPDAHVYAADVTPGMISLVDRLVASKGWNDRVKTDVMDGVNLHYPNDMFDASITNFGIFFFSDPDMGAREIFRTLKTGGKAIVTCWKDMTLLPILHAVQAIIKPGSVPIVLRGLDIWAQKETMEMTLKRGGFSFLEMHEQEVMWWNQGIDEAAKGLADNFVNMVGDQWSDEEKNGILGVTEQVLKDQGEKFIVESEGMIGFQMVAWIAVATKIP